uniref:Golgin subfamily A member 1 n=1 Tax=Callorhinchus milii TaxID=7868 RepID=A0A4W3GYM8_CALMI
MFAKLKKKIAEEGGASPRPGTARIPRSFSRESITSVGADSGDDIASDSSCPREDLLSQLLRRNDQVRKLEVKLSDYAEQLRSLQKTREKLEIALEKHQDSSMRKLQEQNEAYQISRAKMAEGMTLALNKKDQEWMAKVSDIEKEKARFEEQLQEMKTRSLNLFHRRDEQDELDGFQQQELAKVKHMLLRKEEKLSKVEQELEERSAELHQTKEQLHDSHQRLDNLDKIRERPCSELSCAVGAATTVINNSDMNDSREINFEYLKHVLLKFMSCRESEAFQLLKAVSMLLNFTLEEENMLKANLEYKMSWFWSKPVPPLGRAPPPWH